MVRARASEKVNMGSYEYEVGPTVGLCLINIYGLSWSR